MHAAASCCSHAIPLLLENGADPNAPAPKCREIKRDEREWQFYSPIPIKFCLNDLFC